MENIVSYTDFSSIITAIQNQISIETVVGVLATVVAVSVGFVFMWWGVRKVSGALMKGFFKGRLGL